MSKNHSYKRGIGPIGLTLSAVSAMIGSGWLFSSLYVGQLSGPSSIIAWSLGGLLVMIVALTYAEISTMLPVTGGSTRFPQLTHGTFVSLFFGWITWFNLMTAPAIETQAMIQYASNYWPSLISQQAGSLSGLTLRGFGTAAVMMLLFSVLNIYSIRLITRLNNFLSIFKIGIALLAACALLVVAFHPHNFNNVDFGGFMPQGWKGVFSALATGGILFAFNGFKQAIELGGEAKNPARTIFIGVTASISLVLVIYLALQVSFIGALTPDSLIHGWRNIHFAGDAGPLAGILAHYKLFVIAILLYINALVATSAAGLVYCTSAARTLYGLSANRQLPAFLQEVTTRGIPAKAVAVNFLVGLSFFLPFHGWFAMAEFMSSIIALSYITGPICCLAMRYQLPNHHRTFKLPFIHVWCFLGMYICTMIVYWTGWVVVSKLGMALGISFVLFLTYRFSSKRPRSLPLHWDTSIWMWPYLAGLSIISYLGSYGGGVGVIPFGWDFAYLGVLSLFSLYLAIRFRADDQHVQETMKRLSHEIETGLPSSIPAAVMSPTPPTTVGAPQEA